MNEDGSAKKKAKKDKTGLKKSKKDAPKKKDVKKKAVKKGHAGAPAKAGRDRFGAGVDTITARFNAAVSKKGKTMEQLMKESDITRNYKDHAAKLIDRGFIVLVGDKYKLASKK